MAAAESKDGGEGKEAFDDDGDVEYLIDADAKLSSPTADRKGISLDIGAAVAASIDREGVKPSEEDLIVERSTAPVRVLFELPDGSQVESEFQMGQSVEVLKSFVNLEVGLPMHAQALYLDDKLLIDPLSLLDYPEIDPREEVVIRVEGDMEDDGGAKK